MYVAFHDNSILARSALLQELVLCSSLGPQCSHRIALLETRFTRVPRQTMLYLLNT